MLAGHLRCAAAELPLTPADAAHFGDTGLELARSLPDISAGPAGLVYRGSDHPAARIALRSASPNAVVVIEAGTGTLLGLVDEARADSTVHEGAIYLHLGQQYVVRALDTISHVALVAPFDGDYYTQTRRLSATSIEEELEHRELAGTRVSFGRLEVIEQVIGYQRKRLINHEPIDMIALDMPERHFQTEAVWYVPAQPPQGADLLGSLHAAEHAMIGLLPLLATADRGDIGGLSTDLHPQTGAPTIFVYDGHPGGAGIAHRGYELFEGWVDRTAALLRDCPCESGCPSCVQSPKCGNLNEPLSKPGARSLLETLLPAKS